MLTLKLLYDSKNGTHSKFYPRSLIIPSCLTMVPRWPCRWYFILVGSRSRRLHRTMHGSCSLNKYRPLRCVKRSQARRYKTTEWAISAQQFPNRELYMNLLGCGDRRWYWNQCPLSEGLLPRVKVLVNEQTQRCSSLYKFLSVWWANLISFCCLLPGCYQEARSRALVFADNVDASGGG